MTLLELVIVMTIILLVGAAFYPSIDSAYGYFKVTGASDAIKSAWSRARARAIEDNVAYRFSVASERGSYRIAPDRADFWTGEGTPDMDPERPMLILEGKLPRGIRFNLKNQGSSSSSSKSSDVPDDVPEKEDAPVSASEWTTVAIFLPDGTAQDDVEICFEMKGTRPVTLKLRSITGTIKTVYGQEDR